MKPRTTAARPACPLCKSPRTELYSRHEDLTYRRCLGCAALFAHPMLDRETLRASAEHWAKLHHASPDKIESDFSPFIREASHLPRLEWIEGRGGKGRILDIGCAVGGFLESARLDGWEPIGVELAESSARYGREERNLDIRTGFFPGVTFPDETFDAVTLWEVVEHVDDPLDTLREAFRVLRPGGVVAMSTPNLSSLTTRVLGPKWDVFSPGMHLFLFSPASIEWLLDAAGFTGISTSSEDLNPVRLVKDGLLRRGPDEPAAVEAEADWEKKKKQKSLLMRLLREKEWARKLRRATNAAFRVVKVADTLLARARKPDGTGLAGPPLM